MLSKWLFTAAVAASTLIGSASAAPPASKKVIDIENAATVNLLEEVLPPYDAKKDVDGLLKHTYTAVEKLIELEKNSNANGKRAPGKCNLKKVTVRREWGALTNNQKKSYTNAIKCLMTKPARSDPAFAPGAKSRYDDFVAVHMVQTVSIHATANFLSWHRWYLHLFDKALREECGYAGPTPYWNWGNTANKPYPSYIFNDSEFGLSGDGEYIPHNPNGVPLGGGLIVVPTPKNGGGCVTTGPFANITVNLGPIDASNLDIVSPSPGFLEHNPRCLRRVINQYISSRWGTHKEVLDLIVNPKYSKIGPFQNRFQGEFENGYVGVHAAGHFTMGGDPGGDFFASPGEPVFWVHHGQVDRVWWMWQMADPRRINTIAGTITLFNDPPSRNGTLQDEIEMGVLTPEIVTIGDLVSTTKGPFCYIYL
ncbi:Di-copper centre-containing protein [Ascobolus immersus RN42]|uniref:Di-copper centre-containing protein n=1 Tax=Ascobolus immersus RN42 TaxID=1160509 RepID=A0A3N4ISL9_ASCIM|nr:Di-copper centre-containing protein [Ascobolus immersus RN42]